MAITDWPADERPREKLLERGANALTDAELLAIFLRTGIKGKTAVDLARELLNTFGSLSQLLLADQQQFCREKGLGDAKYAQLQAVLEMSRRHLMARLRNGDVLSSPSATRDYLTSRLNGLNHELFACLHLDNQHRVLQYEELFRGSIDSASVYPREVVKSALKHNAAAIIFAHNHPSGVTEPSQDDIQITYKLRDALDLVDIRVLDHLIIGNGSRSALSFAEQGLL